MFPVNRAIAGQTDSLSSRYQRGINTDLWAGGCAFEKKISRDGLFQFNNFFSSSRLQGSTGTDKWKDQNQLNLSFSRMLGPSWAFLIKGSSFIFSDKQTGFMNDIQTHFLGAGTVYRRPNLSMPLSVGIKNDRRYGRTDQGWNIQTALEIPHFQISGYSNRLSASLENDNLRKRKNATLSLSYLVHKQFYADTYDSLSYSIRQQRRDYYISPEGDVESWDETGQNVENILTYGLSRKLRLRIQGGLITRTLKIRQLNGAEKGLKRERKDFSTSGSARLVFRTGSFFSDFGISITGEEQNYQLVKSAAYSPYSGVPFSVAPDNKSAWTVLSLNSRWNWSQKDTFIFHARLQKLQYDTPDPMNIDDRDDLRYWLNVQQIHAFSPVLRLRLAADVYYLHLVYLSGRKSADNNRTRIFRFYPSVLFNPSQRLSVVQSAEVLANYVDYDFETSLPGIRSFLYRKFRLDDSLRVGLGSPFAVYLYHRIELDENGKLVWDKWLEEKLLDRKSQTASIEFWMTPMGGLSVIPGYSYYHRRGYRYVDALEIVQEKNRQELAQDFYSQGPTLRVYYHTRSLMLTFQLSDMAIRTLGLATQKTFRVDLNMNWQF